ncbi:unnamed protein product [Protopolystoma xenopodis]|uniref:WD repeat-containing protein 92 n=1 Tax=Protopolystoma xenopodis TaxID=117903 RepID=A0A3S5APY8_9PLAT|nr:unnamed protein product [Protopolystoma xenopodis]
MMTTGGNGSLNLWKYEYPTKRRKLVKETQVVDGTEREVEVPQGVMGSLTQLQNITLSNQPISGFDWCAEKTGLAVCVAFDQTVRLLITTKLNRL